MEPEAHLVQPKPIASDKKYPSQMNCHVIIDAYMDDDMDIFSAHMLTGHNQRWANFGPISAIFTTIFLAIFAGLFQHITAHFVIIFSPLFSPLLQHI